MPTDDELLPRVASIMRNAGHGTHRDLLDNLRLGQLLLCEYCLLSKGDDGFKRCFPCNKKAPQPLPDAYFLTISGATQQSVSDMASYKSELPSVDATSRLGLLLYFAFKYHMSCLAGEAHRFDLITCVPSGRSDRSSLIDLIPDAGIPVVPMSYQQPFRDDRASWYEPSKFIADPNVFSGKRVLLIEDTWLKGYNAISAAKSLRLAGATVVKVLVIARRMGHEYAGQGAVLNAMDPLARYAYRFCPVDFVEHD